MGDGTGGCWSLTFKVTGLLWITNLSNLAACNKAFYLNIGEQ